MNTEIEIIKPEEIKHLKERVKTAVMIFEDKLNIILFDTSEIRMDIFMQRLEEYFLLGKGDAILLSRYLFERRNKPIVIYQKDTLRRSNFISRRLKEFVGKYEKVSLADMNDIKVDYNWFDDADAKKSFIDRLKDFGQNDFVTPLDISNLVLSLNIGIDLNLYLLYLCRLSMSLSKIKGDIINDSIVYLFSSQQIKRDTKFNIGTLGISQTYTDKHDESESNHTISKEDNYENMVKIGQQVFVRLAEFLYSQKTTLMPLLHSKIYDKILDGKEYQLIKYRHFYQQLKTSGFSLSIPEKKAIEHVITPFLPKTMELKSLMNLLSKLGIVEPFPKSTRHLDYKS